MTVAFLQKCGKSRFLNPLRSSERGFFCFDVETILCFVVFFVGEQLVYHLLHSFDGKQAVVFDKTT